MITGFKTNKADKSRFNYKYRLEGKCFVGRYEFERSNERNL